MDDKQLMAAARIEELIPEWDRDTDKTPEEIATDIYNEISVDPVSVINFLLGIIDDLQA